MKKIIFVCHGNICRSPMAEYVFKDLVAKKGRSSEFDISSAAVSYEEIGNDIYPPAKRKMHEKGVPFSRHSAHRITPDEYDSADLVLVMDSYNLRLMDRIIGLRSTGKLHLLSEYGLSGRDISDPWYSGDFEATYNDILLCCTALLETL